MTNKEIERRINNAYMDGRADAIEEFATRLEENLLMVLPRDKVNYLMYEVHKVLEQMKEEQG